MRDQRGYQRTLFACLDTGVNFNSIFQTDSHRSPFYTALLIWFSIEETVRSLVRFHSILFCALHISWRRLTTKFKVEQSNAFINFPIDETLKVENVPCFWAKVRPRLARVIFQFVAANYFASKRHVRSCCVSVSQERERERERNREKQREDWPLFCRVIRWNHEHHPSRSSATFANQAS